MKNIYLAVFLIAFLFPGCSSENENMGDTQEKGQTTLFDKGKEAIAYIDYDDEATIYMFEGEAVAYIESNEQVYGFNGKLLGWYSDGVLYDKTYNAVGAKHGIVRGELNTAVTHPERIKGVKQVKPTRPVKGGSFPHPVLKDSWSATSLVDFFKEKQTN